jgi:hypothetical protein
MCSLRGHRKDILIWSLFYALSDWKWGIVSDMPQFVNILIVPFISNGGIWCESFYFIAGANYYIFGNCRVCLRIHVLLCFINISGASNLIHIII